MRKCAHVRGSEETTDECSIAVLLVVSFSTGYGWRGLSRRIL